MCLHPEAFDDHDVAFWPILLKKSKVEPGRKTVDMTTTSSIDSK
jgi:hypothetical protein